MPVDSEFSTDPPLDTALRFRAFAAGWMVLTLVGSRWLFALGWAPAAYALLVAGWTWGLLGLAWPRSIRPLYRAWTWIMTPVGWLLAMLALAGVYYFVVTPIGLLLRWRGHDPLCLRRRDRAESYWRRRATDDDLASYFRQF